MENVVVEGADRVVAVDPQRRGDQVVGSQGEEIDALRPEGDQGNDGRDLDHDAERHVLARIPGPRESAHAGPARPSRWRSRAAWSA